MKSLTQEIKEFNIEMLPDPKPELAKAKTPRELVTQWLLDKLQEESAEVIQAISKVRRFGEHNHHPDRATTNHQELIGELEDWLAIVAALEHYKYFDLTKQQATILKKAQQLIG
jgi:NTP pyrophosphatase (non-canonical NTP hydrolase)